MKATINQSSIQKLLNIEFPHSLDIVMNRHTHDKCLVELSCYCKTNDRPQHHIDNLMTGESCWNAYRNLQNSRHQQYDAPTVPWWPDHKSDYFKPIIDSIWISGRNDIRRWIRSNMIDIQELYMISWFPKFAFIICGYKITAFQERKSLWSVFRKSPWHQLPLKNPMILQIIDK